MCFAKKVGEASPEIWQSPLLKLYQSRSKSGNLIWRRRNLILAKHTYPEVKSWKSRRSDHQTCCSFLNRRYQKCVTRDTFWLKKRGLAPRPSNAHGLRNELTASRLWSAERPHK